MVIDNPDDKWRERATRLIADTALLDSRFERDFFGNTWVLVSRSAPTSWKPADWSVPGRRGLAERIDQLHGDQIDSPVRDRLHAAQRQLHATIEALTGLPEALDPNYGR